MSESAKPRTEDEILRLEEFLPYRLMRLADAVSRSFAETYRHRHGLTRPEWRVFATLGEFETMTATAIGRHSSMHKTKVSRAVAALEKRKWVARSLDPDDRRIEHLSLTRAGRAAYRDMVPVARGFEDDVLGRLSDKDRKLVADALQALERRFSLRR
jgi:DNA-binding MarR family transcriptional regulator